MLVVEHPGEWLNRGLRLTAHAAESIGGHTATVGRGFLQRGGKLRHDRGAHVPQRRADERLQDDEVRITGELQQRRCH